MGCERPRAEQRWRQSRSTARREVDDVKAVLADADALVDAARWRAANDATFFGFSPLDSELASPSTSNVCGNGVLLKSL